jgi:hypothetical protein
MLDPKSGIGEELRGKVGKHPRRASPAPEDVQGFQERLQTPAPFVGGQTLFGILPDFEGS